MRKEPSKESLTEGRRSQFLSLSKSKTKFLYMSDWWRHREPCLALSVSTQGPFMTTGTVDTLLGYTDCSVPSPGHHVVARGL